MKVSLSREGNSREGNNFDTQLSTNADLYDDLRSKNVVVGDFSTALYEAVPFGIPVILLKQNYATINLRDRGFFTEVDGVASLCACVQALETKPPSVTENNKMWDRDWKCAYKEFINELAI